MTNSEVSAIVIAEKYHGQVSFTDKIKHLAEEVVELGMGLASNDKENMKEEIGDCAYILLHIAYKLDPNRSLLRYIDDAAEKLEVTKGLRNRKT